jgi:hypothetical protein
MIFEDARNQSVRELSALLGRKLKCLSFNVFQLAGHAILSTRIGASNHTRPDWRLLGPKQHGEGAPLLSVRRLELDVLVIPQRDIPLRLEQVDDSALQTLNFRIRIQWTHENRYFRSIGRYERIQVTVGRLTVDKAVLGMNSPIALIRFSNGP